MNLGGKPDRSEIYKILIGANLINLTSINQLPKEIPLILLRGAVLLPKAQIPLPDTLLFSTLKNGLSKQNLIGLIQPSSSINEISDFDKVPLFSTGTLARIIEIDEMTDTKAILTLEGVCRFKIVDKYKAEEGHPMAQVSYEDFTADLIVEDDFVLDRDPLLNLLKTYFRRLDISLNLEEINKVSNQKLITALTMVCPFLPSEKQILLETYPLKNQSLLIKTLIEMAVYPSYGETMTYH